MALAEPAVLIRHFDTLVTQRVALAIERQASFRSVVGAVLRGDARIEHHDDAAAELLVHERDDAFALADHVRGHTDAAIAVRVECVLQILCYGEVGFRIPRRC